MSMKIVTPLSPIHVVDGAPFASFTTFQDISPSPQLIIPQQWMEVGLDIDIEAWGEFTNTGTRLLVQRRGWCGTYFDPGTERSHHYGDRCDGLAVACSLHRDTSCGC